MANTRVRELYPQEHPRIQRSLRTRFPRTNVASVSKADLLGFILSKILSFIPTVLLKLCPEWISSWVHWCPTSQQALELAEQDVLSSVRRPYRAQYVNIGRCCGQEDNFIWTLSLTQNGLENKTPLLLIHGFACGVGLWVMNLDSLSLSRPVYAFDMLGFGRSSRPTFSIDAVMAEQQFVMCIEKWRIAMGLEKFILLGHSMGGYITASYALQHPDRVELLILVDPWGIPERPISLLHRYDMPSWVKFIHSFLRGFNLLAGVRAAGPVGPSLVKRFRSDLRRKYGHFLQDPEFITEYIYHCNAQNPSGEVGFKAMTDESGWAKNPMLSRLSSLHWKVPITFVYGSRSWTNRQPGLQIKYSRLNSFVDVQVIEGAGHHVYADKPEQFNALINRVCESLENGMFQENNL